MDWTARPLHATNLQARNFQVQGLYQSQQPASGFSQTSASTPNSSAYTRNDQAIKIHSSTENMVPNQLSSSNNVGFSNFQPPPLKPSVPIANFETTQHFDAHRSHLHHSSVTVQMTPGMAKNIPPNSNMVVFSPVAPQPSTASPVQRPPNRYIAPDMYNRPQKKGFDSVQGSLFQGNRNSSYSKRLPVVAPKYQPTNLQARATVPLNQVSSHFLNSQPNYSCLTFSSGQNIQNQKNDINSGSTTAVHSQQYASNCVYSSPYIIPIHYAAQVIPQPISTNLPPPPPYAVPPVQVNHGQSVLPQLVPNTSNGNVQSPQNVNLDQSNVSCSVQHAQTPESVPISRETNEIEHAADSLHGHSAENQPSSELATSAVEALNNMYNSLQKPATFPLDTASTPQKTSIMVENNTPKGSENVFDKLIKSKPITKESLELDVRKMYQIKKKLLALQAAFKLKHQLYLTSRESKASYPSVHNPDNSVPTSNTSQQPAALPQATHQTVSLPSHDSTQNLTSLLPHDNTQNRPPSLLACSSSHIQDCSSLPLRTKKHLYPILQDLLKGTIDEEMLFNTQVVSTEKNQSKQLFVDKKCSSGSVLNSGGAKVETSMNDMERASRLNPRISQIVSTQGFQTSTDVSLGFEQTSALDKGQITNMSATSGGHVDHLVLNKVKMETTVTKIPIDSQSTISVQNPIASSESSQLNEQLATEGSKTFQNPRSKFIQQSKDNCLKTSDMSITAWNNRNDISTSASLVAPVPEADRVQMSSFMGNSCTMERTCSLEELETSLALWRKSPATSLNDQLGEKTKVTMHSPSLDGVEDKEMEGTMKNFANVLIHNEKSSITAGKSEPTLSSISSSLGQKLDAVSSSASKSSEPQVAIVPPLILSKEGIQNEVKEKDLSSMLEKMYPVIAEGSIHSLHGFVLQLSDTDKPVKRTACSPSDSCITVKEVDSDRHQKTAKSVEENEIQRAESGTDYSCDPKEGFNGLLEVGKKSPQLYSRDSFPPGNNNDNSSPISQKCALKTSPDFVEAEDPLLNENMLQISSVCTLVQGDASYNSQIASIFNTSSNAENNPSSEDQRCDSYNKEQQLSQWERESEMNGSASVGVVLLPSLGTVSKAVPEKLLSLPGLKISQGGKDSDEVNVRNPEEEKTTKLVHPSSGKSLEQNMSCSDVHSRDLSSGYQEIPGNSIVDEGSMHSIQEHVPSDENQLDPVNNSDIAPTLPTDQLTELLKEFPYGIDDSKALKKTENEDFATKVSGIKDGQKTEICGQNSEASHALDQIIITILNPQQMKELFPDYSNQSSNKLENRENKLSIASEDTNKSHIETILVESSDTSPETVQKPASHLYCCTPGWLASQYAVVPCPHMVAREAALKQQLGQPSSSEIMIKEGSETHETPTDCQPINQQQAIYPTSNNFLSEVESNQILSKTFVHRENDLQKKEAHKLLKDKGLNPLSLEKLEPMKPKNKVQRIEELAGKVQIDEWGSQQCTTLISKSQEVLYSGTHDSIKSACKRDKERTQKETVVDKSKSDTLRYRSMESKHSKRSEKYKIKRDSSETHIIKGPTYPLKRGVKKHTTSEGKQKIKNRPCAIINSSNLSSVDLVSKTYNNAQYSQEHLNRQKCKIERLLKHNRVVRTEHSETSSSESVQQNKGSFARKNLKKFAYSEERGNVWKYRRSLSDNIKISKVQTFRAQHFNMYKTHSSGKEVRYFEKTLNDKKSPCNRKSNILTLQREQKKNYLNKVAFRQTERSICLTKLEQSPSKSVWHVKTSNASEHPEDTKNCTLSSQQSEVVKPQMLEFKMCPEIVFRDLGSEEVSDAKKLPEKEKIPVSAVKSRREDWLNYTPPKRRKTDEQEPQADDRIPLDTALELLNKNEAIKNSNTTFETYRKMHLQKRSRSLDSSPLN